MRLEDAKIRLPDAEKVHNKKKLRTSVYTEDHRGEYYNIKIDKLIPFKNQSRKYFDQKSIEELAKTIKKHGIRQPLTILPSDEQEGYYEIVSGERRYRAAKFLKFDVVPCIILLDRNAAEEIALIENIQREDLHPIELMNAYNNLLKNNICSSMQEIADKLGIAKSSVVETLNLKLLSIEAQERVLNNKITNRDFFRLLCKAEPSKQLDLINRYLENTESKKEQNHHIKKIKIFSISFQQNDLLIENKNLEKLSTDQKNKLRNCLMKLAEDL